MSHELRQQLQPISFFTLAGAGVIMAHRRTSAPAEDPSSTASLFSQAGRSDAYAICVMQNC